MEINKDNYQAIFLDYFEGQLEATEVAELMVFLEANPNLNAEFESFEVVELLPSNNAFRNKRTLKKSDYKTSGEITAFNYEEWMVAGMEKDLDEDELKELDAFLAINPSARLEYNQFFQSRMVAGPEGFEHKDQLKKKAGVVLLFPYWKSTLAVAASLLIFLSVWLGGVFDPDPVDRIGFTAVQPEIIPATQSEIPRETEKVQTRNTHSYVFEVGPAAMPDAETETITPPPGEMQFIPANSIPVLPEMGYESQPVLAYRTENLPALQGQEPEIVRDAGKTSFAGRFINGTFSRLFGSGERNRKSFLEYTVDGYNLMADREVDVEKELDASGNIVAYRINGEVIKIGRKVNSTLSE